ncbi:protein arginine kinase [Peptococcaceae bacterium 1198_IL3148]
MGIKDIVNNAHSSWMNSDGPEGDVITSSRIRIARNLSGIPFPNSMSTTDAEAVFHAVQQAVSKSNQQLNKLELLNMGELTPVERRVLMDKHLISPDLLKDYQKKAVVLSENEVFSIMLNEEDHLRIQCLLPGLQLEKAWELANNLDDDLEQVLDYAYSAQLGYLTACPTNVGTGLRASVMLHLPGLTMLRQINPIINAIAKLGITVRGLYGEGTQAMGNLYQVSNQVTLGLSEEEIIDKLSSIIRQIIDQERAARQAVHHDNKYQLEDRIFRAYGTLKYARLLTTDETMKLISEVKLGVNLRIIEGVDASVLNQLLVMIQPAYLQKQANRELSAQERDVLRAKTVRDELNINK